MLLYVIAYDVPCNKRRQKIAKLLEGYGQRVQYSVFECVLTNQQYQELKRRLKGRFQEKEDSVRFYPLSAHTLTQIETWGGPPIHTPPGSFIV